MNDTTTYILDNKEWIFSGIGVEIIGIVATIIIGLIVYFFKKKSIPSVSNIATGNNNNQAGGDINIYNEEKKKLDKREIVKQFQIKLSKLDNAMFEINPFRIREMTGKNEKVIADEENERLEIARAALDDYGKYYNENKIFFNEETSELIKIIANKFRQYHRKIVFVKNMNLSLSDYLKQQLAEINTETSKLINLT